MRRLRGFTIMEVIVTVGVVSILMVGMLTLLDNANQMTKQQTNVADAQAASRTGIFEVARVVRQARIGQLYYANSIMPFVVGSTPVNNASGSETITDLNGAAHTIRQGTDALEVRGVIYGDWYFLNSGDVSCGGGNCSLGSNNISVTIEQTVRLATGGSYQNYPTGGKPALATRTKSFFFVVTCTAPQTVTANGVTLQVPLYYVGKVNASGTWYTQPADKSTFTFTLDATDTAARQLNATSSGAPFLQQPFSGGAVDDVVFFVDRGAADAVTGKYVHPALSQAVFDPQVGAWDVQPIADDVEDFQVAYGIDGAGPGPVDGGVDPATTSATKDADEWVYDATSAAESLTLQTNPNRFEAFVSSVAATGGLARPALKSLMLSVVVASHDPDLKYAGPGATGVATLDSNALSLSNSSLTGLPYRRRVQTMAVSLRNFQ